MSKQAICWPVSHDHIIGSGVELMEVTYFLKMTADRVMVNIPLDRGLKLFHKPAKNVELHF